MKYSLKLVKYIVVVCIFSNACFLSADCCKKPKQGPPGKNGAQGPAGPAFATTYGSFYLPSTSVEVDPGAIVPFSITGTASGITNAGGTFTLALGGVYQVFYGATFGPPPPANVNSVPFAVFALNLNGSPVPNGYLGIEFFPTINPVGVIFSAAAGSQVTVTNFASFPLFLGTGDGVSNGAFITFVRIASL